MNTIDPRHIASGWEIPTESYSDQPYIMLTDDGAWLCTVTTGAGHEGQTGQHVIALRSTDGGRTWSAPIDIEPSDGPEASYAVMFKTPAGRIYCFYNHNTDNIREAKADDPPFAGGICRRVDSLGYFVFKYSDDGGRTWSDRRWTIPVREMDIDRRNPYGGEIRYFWNVGKPFVHAGAAFVPLIKVGGLGHGFFTRTEGVLLRCANLLTETDPDQFVWETLPDGDFGLRTPPGGGPIAEEQSYVVLSDGSFYAVYRTVDGHPCEAYSRDGGRTWSTPQYKRYADGRLMKHPRAANFAWRCANGKYLYWFHNHGGCDYDDRNPVWLCGGVEADGPDGKIIRWSQPEIVLYDDDPIIRMSYPDLVEDGGEYYLTETNKDVARVHRLDPVLLEGLWNQFDGAEVAEDGLLLSLQDDLPAEVDMPKLPAFLTRDWEHLDMRARDLRQGFSLDLWVQFDTLVPGQILLDNRTPEGRGFCLQTTAHGSVELLLNDGQTENRWTCDPGLLTPGRHHLVAIVDGGPKIISFVVDGLLCDGGAHRQFGWGRFSPYLRSAIGTSTLRISQHVSVLRLYGRALRTSEAIGHWQSES